MLAPDSLQVGGGQLQVLHPCPHPPVPACLRFKPGTRDNTDTTPTRLAPPTLRPIELTARCLYVLERPLPSVVTVLQRAYHNYLPIRNTLSPFIRAKEHHYYYATTWQQHIL